MADSTDQAMPSPPATTKAEETADEIMIDAPEHATKTEEIEQVSADGATTEDKPAKLTNDEIKIMKGIVDYLTDYKDADGNEITASFQRLVNKRILPDYFEVIKEPTAFSTARGKLLRKLYTSWKEFVRDFALISHNAQVYNRASAPVYSEAIQLRELFKMEMAKLVSSGTITADDAEYPDLGELPTAEDSPLPGPDDEEDEDEDEEDEEDEDEDTDDEKPKKKGRKSRPSMKREGSRIKEDKEDPDAHKVRGRPPRVHTPMEARINTLLKGLRKFKHSGGDLKILPFEKLPDKQVLPDYYQEIKNPIAMDLIKRKAKRKKYHSVDAVLKDVDLLFENAKQYNLETSQVYQDAVDLQREAHLLAEQEKQKPDSSFVDDDGRLPLSEILHNGELWKVGDWVHITNPNDPTKPIVAQIYRTWQDVNGQKWINACWYYRPEQTVHRFEKHFFENEVVKTGRYQDHQVNEIVDRCFVMFVTRFNKGRPRGFPADKEVYVCEARYNEEKFKLNKIKTWASCVPDEVREKDYEMDLFDAPRKMKKIPSPIKHLLRDDAKEDDPLPKPTWSASNAPPLVGAVHKRPREANESPPPEPTPTPPPEAVVQSRPITSTRPYDNQGDIDMGSNDNSLRPRSSAPAQGGHGTYGQQFGASRVSASPVPQLNHQTSYGSQNGVHSTANHQPAQPVYNNHATYTQNNYTSNAASYPSALPPAHQNHTYTPAALPTSLPPQPVQSYTPQPPPLSYRPSLPHSTSGSGSYSAPAPPGAVYSEVYTLPDNATSIIPPDIRQQFKCDEAGRILWFSSPPVKVDPVPAPAKSKLFHSVRFIAKKLRDENAKREAERKADGSTVRPVEKRLPTFHLQKVETHLKRSHDEAMSFKPTDIQLQDADDSDMDRSSWTEEEIRRGYSDAQIEDIQRMSALLFAKKMDEETEHFLQREFGADWEKEKAASLEKAAVLQREGREENARHEAEVKRREDSKRVKIFR